MEHGNGTDQRNHPYLDPKEIEGVEVYVQANNEANRNQTSKSRKELNSLPPKLKSIHTWKN